MDHIVIRRITADEIHNSLRKTRKPRCGWDDEKMKKKLLMLLLALLLGGCAFDTAQQEIPAESTEPAASTSVAVPEEETTQTAETEQPATEATVLHIVQPEPENEDFVPVRAYIPDIAVELPYASAHNFTGQKIYDFGEVWLRYGTVKKLALVQAALREQGLCLKIWDGFRPPAAQFRLWTVCPDPTYVSDPNRGFSSHSRGNTVDITLVDPDGRELTMPTGFDDFTERADRDYSDCSPEAAANALLLEQVMLKYGFQPYAGEWWHYSDQQQYPVEQVFTPVEAAWYYADCKEYISLRVKPDVSGDVITTIPAAEQLRVVALHGDFALVAYQGLYGYVLQGYICPVE